MPVFHKINFNFTEQADGTPSGSFGINRQRYRSAQTQRPDDNYRFLHEDDSATGQVLPKNLSAKLLGKKLLFAGTFVILIVHIIGWLWLKLPGEKPAPARPPLMEFELIPPAAPKPKTAPPPPAAPAAKIKPIAKKAQPKPVQKKLPVVPEEADFTLAKQRIEPEPAADIVPPVPASVDLTTEAKTEAFVEAELNATYQDNPKPEYPSIAKSRGWQGKVLLRVLISELGFSESVSIEHSSGYDILDESARAAVKQWRFTPARRGETPVASSVIIPVIFVLRDQEWS